MMMMVQLSVQVDTIHISHRSINWSESFYGENLCQDLNGCKEKIKSQTERRTRQEDVMGIGQRAKETCNETVNEVNQNRECVTRVIELNHGIQTRIDFVANERVYKQILC
eukprot:228776_1